ncbi:hypothetical protein R1sor_019959 [Riccia sorocarpa]|uniref:Reverse transcriptase domain-containing protein n=1 Tax=Riccia sorocarpa TaxID=122646 RepID=A0ABD3IID6_9MARC
MHLENQPCDKDGRQAVAFRDASSLFRDAKEISFQSEKIEQSTHRSRPPLTDRTNRTVTGTRSESRSPEAKKTKKMGTMVDLLAQQIETQSHIRKNLMAGGQGEPSKSDKVPPSTSYPTLQAAAASSGGTTKAGEPKIGDQSQKGQRTTPATTSSTTKMPAAHNVRGTDPISYAGVAAANAGQNRRFGEQKQRGGEPWRQAKERREKFFRNAMRSDQCISKNRERFDRQKEGTEDLYPELLKDVEVTYERQEEVRTTFEFLRTCYIQDSGKKTVQAKINHQALLNRNEFLRARSFVLYTVDISPSRDVVLDWAEVILHQEMGIRVERVRVLSRQCYLITVENEADRDLILDATPLFLGPHMVFALPWETTFNPANLATCKVPIWVDLPNIHPSLEGFGAELLQNVGEVLYTTCEETECRFTNIRGCLRLNLSKELPEYIQIIDPETNEDYLHPIIYRSMPDACFHCHKRGHVVRACPIRKQKKVTQEQRGKDQPEAADEEKNPGDGIDEDGFQTVPGRKGKAKDTNQVPLNNSYEALEEVEEGESKERSAEEHKQDNSGGTGPRQETEGQSQQIDMEVEKEAKRKRDREKEAQDQGPGAPSHEATGQASRVPVGTEASKGPAQPLPGGQKKPGRKDIRIANSSARGGGVALLVRRNWEVVERGVRGDGTLAWVRVKVNNRIIGFIAVHGARDRSERARLWRWIADKWDTGEWYIGGDINSVETQEDSIGETAVQVGAERRNWTSLTAQYDLADTWLEAYKRSGPWFTRQKEVGGRIDQARLDRIYYPKNQVTTNRRIKMQHDDGVRLSDHHPICFTLEKLEGPGDRRCSTYFKVCPELIKKTEVRQEVKDRWEKAGGGQEDARVRWDLKWAETRRYLKEKSREERAKRSVIQEKLEELKKKRRKLARNRTHLADGELMKLEKEIQILEDSQCVLWRRWSQMRWMKQGDAPSKFFFNLLRVKRLKDKITTLEREDRSRIETREEILEELHRFYVLLYKQESVAEETEDKRRMELTRLEDKVSEEQNNVLIRIPTVDEIHWTVRRLKNEKAPGADGMTAEMVKEIWDNSKQDVIDFVLTFWNTDTMSWKQLSGIIKLIPKEGDRLKIKNWRPLQMLNTGYKIISKIMANRLGEVIGSVVDREQKGFIKGRSIADNVLNFLISQEWAEVNNDPAMFVKLDFEKAYDLVNHKYLWATMEAMGFHKKFIALNQGLVQGSRSKIHVNGHFSEDIPIERGVKQGCPLAPLLFAISTQPLMSILKGRRKDGTLKGLALCSNTSALHNLFADDTGVMLKADPENFAELQTAIHLYEEISGARLNIEKSTIIPIATKRTPDWMNRLDCYIAREGEVIRYLGHPVGWNVKENQKCDYIIGKLQKRLGNWMYRMLSFAGRMVVMKYILKAMPNHLFTCLALNKQALGRMEAECRKFLWGKSDRGSDRVPLIAWKEIMKDKGDGGLAATSFLLQGKAMRLKHFLKVFTEEEEDWIRALKALLQHAAAKRQGGKVRRHWSPITILLTKCPKRIPRAQTTTGFLTAWNEARGKVAIETGDLILEGWTHYSVYVDILEEQGTLTRTEAINIRKALAAAKIESVGQWADWARDRNRSRPLREMDTITVETGMNIEVQSGPIEELPWRWKLGTKEVATWTLTTRQCKSLLMVHDRTRDRLNRKWGIEDNSRQWAKRFKGLWTSYLPEKEKTWAWKVLHHGLPTLERTYKWGHGDGRCVRCGNDTETIEHMLWQCVKARNKWRNVEYLANGLFGNALQTSSWIEGLDIARRKSIASYILFVICSRTIWLKRNQKCYAGKNADIPLSRSFEQAMDMLKTRSNGLREETRKQRPLNEALESIKCLSQRLGAQSGRADHQADGAETEDELLTDNGTS